MSPLSLLFVLLLNGPATARAFPDTQVVTGADTLAVAPRPLGTDAPDMRGASADGPIGAGTAAEEFARPALTDTTRRRPRAVEVSDAYAMRLRIHRYASYTMIPLFAVQSVAGNQLYQADRTGAEKPGWAKATHAVGAAGLGALFTINTVTGAWNLWESRDNETGRTKRWIHSILLLASDAGFTYAGISAGDARESQATRDSHRNVSYAAMASALAGYAVMLVGDH